MVKNVQYNSVRFNRDIGNVANLSTENKSNLVDAINELKSTIDFLPTENFFSLASGFVTQEDLAPIATGEVLKYTYQGGAIRYRFIANDDSLDAFYLNYESGVFSNLVVTKSITI